jgi:hypothetical protein
MLFLFKISDFCVVQFEGQTAGKIKWTPRGKYREKQNGHLGNNIGVQIIGVAFACPCPSLELASKLL